MNPINFSTSPAIFTWQPAAWLRVAGSDAASFLQGQFTNDLKAGRASYGLWLNVKGKVVADSFVISATAADDFWICSYFCPATAIRERLESFIIADDVTVEDLTADVCGLSVLGPDAERILTQIPTEGVVFPGRRATAVAAEWIFSATIKAEALARLAGAVELTADEMARLRIEAGIPAVPADVGSADLPNEAGLETNAISYTKGCYLGQEVMARLKSMGQVRRRLLRVRGAGAVPARLPAPVFAGAKQAGELRSATPDGCGGFVGLAMLSLLTLGQRTDLSLTADGAIGVSLAEKP